MTPSTMVVMAGGDSGVDLGARTTTGGGSGENGRGDGHLHGNCGDHDGNNESGFGAVQRDPAKGK